MTDRLTSEFEDDGTVLDLLPDAVLGWDAQRRIVAWSRGASALYGYTREEALGRRPAELFATHFPMPLIEIIETLVDTGSWGGDLVQHTKDGREVTVESRWRAHYDEDGKLAGAFAVDRDITGRLADSADQERRHASAERERLQSRLHNAQRLESVGQLAGGIAHDFNNVLAIIINYAALIAGDLDAAERATPGGRWDEMRADLGEIQLAAERAARLTHQLLAFSRQNLGNPVPVDLGESVRGVEELLRRTLGEQIDLEIALADDLWAIRADPAQIDHALVNLAVNSRDAMADGGVLRIDTANVEIDSDYAASRPELLAGPHVRLRVSDTGHGMSPDVLARAFDPFFTTKPVGQGTGLGLATVFGIVRQARGRAQFYSEPGVGTTFTALFPVHEAGPPPPPAPAALPAAGVDTILLVEDEEPLRDATRRILERAGYSVISAPNGASALEAAAAHDGAIDLLLTDIVMPGMPGHRLAAELLALRPEVRVLYMSGFAGPIVEQALHVHAGDLLDKPFTAVELLGRIANARSVGS